MKLTSEELRQLYQKETARSGGDDSKCLSEGMLTSAAAGELSREQREVVADHLASCSSCAKEYRSIRSLGSWVERGSESLAAESSAAPDVDTGPTRLLRMPERLIPASQPFWTRFGGSRPFTSYALGALAALFLILALVFGAQLISQRRENERLVAQVNEKELATAEAKRRAEQAEAAREELAQRAAEAQRTAEAQASRPPAETPKGSDRTRLDQPLANVPIFELEPRGSTRNSGADAVTLEAASDTRLITLILHVNEELSAAAYSLEVVDKAGRPVWTSRGLRQNRYRNFTIALPRRAFPAGAYRLRLYSLRDGRREIVEEYAIELQYR